MPCLFSFWGLQASLGLWPHCSNLCLCGHIGPLHGLLLSSLLLIRTLVISFWAHLDKPGGTHLEICITNLIPLAKTLFPNTVVFTVSRWTYLWGAPSDSLHHGPNNPSRSQMAQPLSLPGVLSGFVLHSANHMCFPTYGYVHLLFFFSVSFLNFWPAHGDLSSLTRG